MLDFTAFAEYAHSGIDWVVIFKNHGDSFISDEEDLEWIKVWKNHIISDKSL